MATKSKIVNFVVNISFFLLPILTIRYIFWVENPQFYIFLNNYRAILYGCNLALWTGLFLALFHLITKKHLTLGILLFITTMPFLFMSSFLSFDDGTTLSNNIASKLDTIQIGTDTYYLTLENGEWGHYSEYLYKCKGNNLFCEQLPFRSNNYGGVHFIRDISGNEINIVNKTGLTYTYGDHPRYYNSDSRTQLKSHLYYLSKKCSEIEGHDCNMFAYTLYECSLNNTLCKQLFFEFKINHEVDLYLEANEAMNEISVYNDYDANKTLIYIYGLHPACYIDGCEILRGNNHE